MKTVADGKAAQAASRSLKDVPPAEIDRDPDNRHIDESDEAFAALVDSVRVFGVLQRLHVRAHGERFQLIDGERRCRAAVVAGLETVSCEVWPAKASRGDVVAAGIVLNDQRQAHAPIHVARRLRELKNAEGLTSEEIARRMAMPLDRVKTYFSLFGASDILIQFLSERSIPLKIAVELVRFERATNEARARKLIERFCESPLTREQIVELRRRATETRSGSEKGSYEGERRRPPRYSAPSSRPSTATPGQRLRRSRKRCAHSATCSSPWVLMRLWSFPGNEASSARVTPMVDDLAGQSCRRLRSPTGVEGHRGDESPSAPASFRPSRSSTTTPITLPQRVEEEGAGDRGDGGLFRGSRQGRKGQSRV